MVATRTQVYLTQEQRRRIDALAASRGITLAEVVRMALDDFLEEQAPDPEMALTSTFGAVPDIEPPSRDEWDRG